jgi:hypothetical protein
MRRIGSEESRMLKVENTGDRYRKTVILQIRLKGKWLMLAGYQPEQHVLISNPEPGVLILRSV